MKDAKRKFSLVSNLAIIVLVFLVFVAGGANVAIYMCTPLREAGFPGTLNMLFDYSKYAQNHDARFLGQIISNAVAYFFMLMAIVLFILSLALIRHDKVAKAKSAVIALFLLLPATLGLTGGIVNFFGEGFKVLMSVGGNDAAIVLFAVLATFLLDIIYLVLAILSLVQGLKTAVKVNRGELKAEEDEEVVTYKESQEEKIARQINEEADRAQLLEDIRQIVKEELNKLDKVVIAKEVLVEKPVEKKVEPTLVEEESQEEKRKGAPRVPFAKKMVKADKEIQEKYNEIKSEILAYGAKARVSISGETFRVHRKPYVKITLVGKTLKVYYALKPSDFVDSPIPVIDSSDKVAYEEVPALLKVKSNLSVKRAKELAKLALEADGITRIKVPEEYNWVKDLRAELRKK